MISTFKRNRHFRKVLVNKTFTHVQEQKKAMSPRHSAYIPSSVKSPFLNVTLDVIFWFGNHPYENAWLVSILLVSINCLSAKVCLLLTCFQSTWKLFKAYIWDRSEQEIRKDRKSCWGFSNVISGGNWLFRWDCLFRWDFASIPDFSASV